MLRSMLGNSEEEKSEDLVKLFPDKKSGALNSQKRSKKIRNYLSKDISQRKFKCAHILLQLKNILLKKMAAN